MNLGHSVEDVVEYFCARSFFADFTIRSPKYCKSNGQEKEGADLLVVFNETLLAVQVKSMQVDPANASKAELRRVTRVVEKAARQFRALGEALRSTGFKSFVNGRGVEIPFDKEEIRNVVLVIVFAPVWKKDPEDHVRIQFDASCYADGPIPIHLFTLEQFSLLLTLLDTLPDFLLYLDARWALHREKLIPEDSDPIDEWAFVTFERKRLVQVLEKRAFVDLTGLQERHGDSVRRLERREKPSYYVDQLIEQLYMSVGSDMPVDSRFNLLLEPNCLKSYQLVIPHLAKLNRKERCRFVEYLLNRVSACRRRELSFRGFKFSEKSDDAYVLMASSWERDVRRIACHNVARGAGVKLGAKRVLGLVVGHDWPESRSCDLMFIDLSAMEVDESSTVLLREVFGKLRKRRAP